MTLNLNPTLQQFVDDHGGAEWVVKLIERERNAKIGNQILRLQHKIMNLEKCHTRDQLIAEMNALREKRSGI